MFAHRFVSLGAVRRMAVLFLAAPLATACGELGCPDALSEVGAVCLEAAEQRETEPEAEPETEPDTPSPEPVLDPPKAERCDGVDNDSDDQIDELWPELGQPCGSSVGECKPGTYVCSEDGASIQCDGAVGPSVEVCDGLDNDCDGVEDNGSPETCNGEDDDCNGLVDDGVLSIKTETFDQLATVASTGSTFILTRSLPNDLRVETYDRSGDRTGYFDDIAKNYAPTAFIESTAADGRLLVGYGQNEFHLLDARVDDEGVPVILDLVHLHGDWDQGNLISTYRPPINPRLSSAPVRFVGFINITTFGFTPIDETPIAELTSPPVHAPAIPVVTAFDVRGPYVVWEDAPHVRAAWLFSDGTFPRLLDVGVGTKPAVATRDAGPGVVFLQDGYVTLSELNAFTLACLSGRFCNEPLDVDPVEESVTTPTGLAYVAATDTWFVAAGDLLLAVGRAEGRAVVQQSWRSRVSGDLPNRVDVESNGSTAAVLQSSEKGKSVLTFMGCL